jgi:hypothetical protein
MHCVAGEVTAAWSQMYLCFKGKKAGYIEILYNVLLSTTFDLLLSNLKWKSNDVVRAFDCLVSILSFLWAF